MSFEVIGAKQPRWANQPRKLSGGAIIYLPNLPTKKRKPLPKWLFVRNKVLHDDDFLLDTVENASFSEDIVQNVAKKAPVEEGIKSNYLKLSPYEKIWLRYTPLHNLY